MLGCFDRLAHTYTCEPHFQSHDRLRDRDLVFSQPSAPLLSDLTSSTPIFVAGDSIVAAINKPFYGTRGEPASIQLFRSQSKFSPRELARISFARSTDRKRATKLSSFYATSFYFLLTRDNQRRISTRRRSSSIVSSHDFSVHSVNIYAGSKHFWDFKMRPDK